MSDLILPLNAERDAVVDDGPPRSHFVAELNRELKAMDPYLELVWVGPRAPAILGIEPGRWHVRRTPPGLVHSYWPVMGPNKEFVDPSMKLIEDMKADDLWRKGALQDLKDRHEREKAKQKKAAALQAEQKLDHQKQDLRAAGRVFGQGGMNGRGRFRS